MRSVPRTTKQVSWNSDMINNGNKKKRIKEIWTDDEFSESLKSQGKLGRRFRLLYLANPMDIYQKRLLDGPIRY